MRYLLGTLNEQEKSLIEERFFNSDEEFEALEIAEEDLIDAYVRDKLSTSERQLFEARLASSARLSQRVLTARILMAKADAFSSPLISVAPAFVDPPAKESSWRNFFLFRPPLQVAMTTAAFLLLLGCAVLVIEANRMRRQINLLVAERAEAEQQKKLLEDQSKSQQAKSEELAAQLQELRDLQAKDHDLIEQPPQLRGNTEQGSPVIGTIVPQLLLPGISRGDNKTPLLMLAPGIAGFRLQLALEQNSYRSYDVLITKYSGSVILRRKGLRAGGTNSPSLVLTVPARLLTQGDYIIRVTGRSLSGTYDAVDEFVFRAQKP